MEQLPAELHGSGWAVQAVHGTTSDAIFTIRRMASVRPNMESVSVVSVIALRARLDREAPEPSVAARVAHRVSVALVQHCCQVFSGPGAFAEADGRLAALTTLFASRGRCGNASALFLSSHCPQNVSTGCSVNRSSAKSPCASEGRSARPTKRSRAALSRPAGWAKSSQTVNHIVSLCAHFHRRAQS
jgi:hypothetical protein